MFPPSPPVHHFILALCNQALSDQVSQRCCGIFTPEIFKSHLGMIQDSSWWPCLDRRGGQEEVTSKLKQPVVLWRQSGIDLNKTQMSTASASPCQAVTWTPERGTDRNWHLQVLSWKHQYEISLPWEPVGTPGDDLFTWSTFTARSGFDQIPQTITISLDPFDVSNQKACAGTSHKPVYCRRCSAASSKQVRIFQHLQSTWVWHPENQHW